jgi:flagellar biogenesis protein FliO
MLRRVLAVAFCAAVCWPLLAQEADSLARLGLRQTDSELPGIGRVVLVLAFTLAVAVGASYAIRRFWVAPLRQRLGYARVSGQLAVSSSLKLHFVDLETTTLVVAEGRGGVAIAEVTKPAAPPDAESATHAD